MAITLLLSGTAQRPFYNFRAPVDFVWEVAAIGINTEVELPRTASEMRRE